MLVVGRSGVSVTSGNYSAHEGHGGMGQAVEFVASVRSAATVFVDPFGSGQVLTPVQSGNVTNVTVHWEPSPSLLRHGTLTFGSPLTGSNGEARATFLPDSERGNGQGTEMHENGQVTARVSASDIITQVYGQPSLGALVPPLTKIGTMNIDVGWHEPEVMRITITNNYDATITDIMGGGETSTKGKDVWTGELAQEDETTWRGILAATTNGSGRGKPPTLPVVGGAGCTWRWNAAQEFDVLAEETLPGQFRLTFTPIGSATGTMGSRKCKPTRFKRDGYLLAPFNDSRITSGGALEYVFPARPGGTVRHAVTSAGLSTIRLRDTYWEFDVEWVPPPPP
jgi:hypothetical protein